MGQIKEVGKMSFIIENGWYFEVDETKVSFISEVEPEDIVKLIPLDDLNDLTRKVLANMSTDPSDEAYRTPQQLAKLNIESIIKDNDIGGTLYRFGTDRILYLGCDSDRYTLVLQWFINIDKNEAFVG